MGLKGADYGGFFVVRPLVDKMQAQDLERIMTVSGYDPLENFINF